MARYLLSIRSVLEIVQQKGLPSEQWLRLAPKRHVVAMDICISAVTPMSVLNEIDSRIDAERKTPGSDGFSLNDLKILKENAEQLFLEFAADDRVVPMCQQIAAQWGILLDMKIGYRDAAGVEADIGGVEKLELATAMVGRDSISFTYVGARQAAHALIPQLRVEDPVDVITAGP